MFATRVSIRKPIFSTSAMTSSSVSSMLPGSAIPRWMSALARGVGFLSSTTSPIFILPYLISMAMCAWKNILEMP